MKRTKLTILIAAGLTCTLGWLFPKTATQGNVNCKESNIRFGQAKADITGPVSDIALTGYMDSRQKTKGIHMRLFSRAFIFANCQREVVFVGADMAHFYPGIKKRVIELLRDSFGNRFTHSNVMISATHTHSQPGGFSRFAIFNFHVVGFVEDNFEAIAQGIFRSIVSAQKDMAEHIDQESSVELQFADFPEGTSVNPSESDCRSKNRHRFNRSFSAFSFDEDKEHPKFFSKDEREFRFRCAVDNRMTQVHLKRKDKPTGLINWFGVHNTTLGQVGHFVSGDHKGLAAYMVESEQSTGFVAAFVQSSEGDVSPNAPIRSQLMDREEQLKKFDTLIKKQLNRMKAIALEQVKNSRELTSQNSAAHNYTSRKIIGPIEHYHRFVDFSKIKMDWKTFGNQGVQVVPILKGKKNGPSAEPPAPESLCNAWLGAGFAGGSEDGTTEFYWNRTFCEGLIYDNGRVKPGCPNPRSNEVITPATAKSDSGRELRKLRSKYLAHARKGLHGAEKWLTAWIKLISFVEALSPADEKKQNICHAPKARLLPGGSLLGIHLTPNVLPIQIFIIGDLSIVAVPFEMTITAGKLLSQIVKDELAALGKQDKHVVIAGLSNAYANYVTTAREYRHQQYEGASTLFGPLTLAGLSQEFIRVLHAGNPARQAAVGVSSETKAEPLYPEQAWHFFPKNPASDDVYPRDAYGTPVPGQTLTFKKGESVRIQFRDGNPRGRDWEDYRANYFRLERTDEGPFRTLTENDFETRFFWEKRTTGLQDAASTRMAKQRDSSLNTFIWDAPLPGKYRLYYNGVYNKRFLFCWHYTEPVEGTIEFTVLP